MKKITILLFILFSIVTVPALDTTRVLCLGNSLRSAWGSFASCATERGMPTVLTQVGYHYSVQDGWINATSNITRDSIRYGRWNYIALQAFGTAGLDYNPDSAIKYVRLWDAFIDSAGHGAQLVLYHVWPTSGYSPIWDTLNGTWKPDSLDKAMGILRSLCSELSIYILPVCAAQYEVQRRDNTIRLHTDWIHGSTEINYLGGMVMFCALTGQDPRGLGNYNSLPAGTVHFLQQVAWQTVVQSDILPMIRPWTRPPLVDQLTLVTESGASTLEKYLTVNITGNFHTTTGQNVSGGNNLLYRSLTPNLLTINHLGKATALESGIALIEARAENIVDTLALTISPSTAVYDSLRISPKVLSSYVTDGFQLAATGYAFHQNQLLAVDFTEAVTWISSNPAVFTVSKGRIFKHTAQGGPMWVAVEREGLKDTVRFTMLQDLSLLLRINFQAKDTVYHEFWKGDWGRPYTDSVGYGWVNTPYIASYADDAKIAFEHVLFLQYTALWAKAGPNYGDPMGEGSYKIKCEDGDYIIKMGVGHPFYHGNLSYVRCGANITKKRVDGSDTLFKFAAGPNYYDSLFSVKTDTIVVRAGQGLYLNLYGPMDYLVVATSAGVNIDSVSFDKLPLPASQVSKSVQTEKSKGARVMACPNPFNPRVALHYSGFKGNTVAVAIYDMGGRLVRRLAAKSRDGVVEWNGLNTDGHLAGSGVYTAIMTDGKTIKTVRLSFLK